MRPAAELLLVESDALRPVLDTAPREAFDRETVCTGWSVRDVLAHCGAALTRTATGDLHSFSPEDNQRDVDERRSWSLDAVLAELFRGYAEAAAAIDTSGGSLDAIGLGEWIHGGDVREPLGAPRPYASAGLDLAVPLLVERSCALQLPGLEATVDGEKLRFGAGDLVGTLTADGETFVRICGGRRPDASRYELTGAGVADLALFT